VTPVDPRKRQMSHMLFHPEIQRATNARLVGKGLALHPVATQQGQTTTLELRNLDGLSEGVRLKQTPGSKRSLDGSYVGITPWVEDNVSALRAASLLAAVMDAEEGVHKDTQGASKPTYGVERFSLSPVDNKLKGRLIGAPWRQQVGYADESVPQAWAAKIMRLGQEAELPRPDGTLVRVENQGYLAIGADGQVKSFPKDALFSAIEGVTDSDGADVAQRQAVRMVAGITAVRAIGAASKARHVAVLEEPKGGASLVTELPNGALATLRTLPSVEAARHALDTYGPSYDAEAAARTRRAAAQDKDQDSR
jgi:hypothetical protein